MTISPENNAMAVVQCLTEATRHIYLAMSYLNIDPVPADYWPQVGKAGTDLHRAVGDLERRLAGQA